LPNTREEKKLESHTIKLLLNVSAVKLFHEDERTLPLVFVMKRWDKSHHPTSKERLTESPVFIIKEPGVGSFEEHPESRGIQSIMRRKKYFIDFLR